MKRKIISAVVLILTVSLLTVCLCSCAENPNNSGFVDGEPTVSMVVLGDSIAEAILGPSPISERDNYGYYGVLAQRNNFYVYNRAVSGHQTRDMINFLERDDSGATMTRTRIKEADVIQVSILGNDLLQNNLGETLVRYINGDTSRMDSILAVSKINFAEIISILKELNPNATLFIQTLYNPMYDGSAIFDQETRDALGALNVKDSEIREYGKGILGKLNKIVFDYLEENPGAYYILDVYSEFDRIYEESSARGKSLIFTDGVHPSNEGHAVIADLTQEKLEELKLTDHDKALFRYKKTRINQLERLYADTINLESVSLYLDSAKSCEEITKIYFTATNGITPIYC